MFLELRLTLTRRKRWIPLLLVTLTIVMSSLLILVTPKSLLSSQSQIPLAVPLPIRDLDSLILKPITFSNSLSWGQQSPEAPRPYNSVEQDKTNATSPHLEKFTIIMLTHQKRVFDLPKTLQHLVGLPGLNGVIIIWNGRKPTDEIRLPTFNFSIQVLANGRNSLNNRFLPLEIIETEAILSMDDDMFPSHESIIFAFRVWQEFRERIVGFPGRGVSWIEGRWKYNTFPCSISMVLTGLAFLHRKYLNLYTHEMPEAIRERVDNVTNCEDIAMNFLVSHITQKPPIKVTSANAWVCPGCDSSEKGKDSLWKDPSHFEERDSCINFFTEIYGYIPLLKSEYRFDDNFENHRDGSCTRTIVHHEHFPGIYYTVLVILVLIVTYILLYFYYISCRRNVYSLR